MISLFQTASGSWHIPSILMASSWLLGTLVTGVFMFANLRVNRNDRIKAFEKERQSVIAASEARTKISALEEKTKQKPYDERLRAFLNEIDPRILPALKNGQTQFSGSVKPYQLSDLQKLAAEKGASEYIKLSSEHRLYIGPEGQLSSVDFMLSPKLIQ